MKKNYFSVFVITMVLTTIADWYVNFKDNLPTLVKPMNIDLDGWMTFRLNQNTWQSIHPHLIENTMIEALLVGLLFGLLFTAGLYVYNEYKVAFKD